MIGQILNHPFYAPLLAGIFGSILGSFIAALVSRWPVRRSILEPRSRCDACGETLRWYELIPILSYLIQQGRCRRCGDQIDGDSIAIEIAAVLIGVIPFLLFLPSLAETGGVFALSRDSQELLSPGSIAALKTALFGWLLLPLAWLDFRHYWLPDRLTLLLALSLVLMIAGLQVYIGSFDWVLTARAIVEYHLLSGVIGFGILWLVSKAYKLWRGREGLGGGDPKLFGAIGMWLGWQMLPIVLFISASLGLVLAGVAMLGGRELTGTSRFPFGTLMALAAWPIYFYEMQNSIF